MYSQHSSNPQGIHLAFAVRMDSQDLQIAPRDPPAFSLVLTLCSLLNLLLKL